MAVAVAVAVSVGVAVGVAVPVAVPVAGLTKRFFNSKDFLINVWGYFDFGCGTKPSRPPPGLSFFSCEGNRPPEKLHWTTHPIL